MLPRLVVGYIVALACLLPLSVPSDWKLQGYTIAITMQAGVPGHLQVFYDAGTGFSEARSATVALQPSDEAQDYRLPLSPGRYRGIRIDPGTTGGRYVIERISIMAPDGSVHFPIPILALAPLYQVSVLEQTWDRLVVEAPPGSNDPAILFQPESPVLIPDQLFGPVVRRLFGRIALLWLCGTGIIWLLEVALRKFGPSGRWEFARVAALCDWHRPAAVCFSAVLATVVATYPVLFLGRSFVAPNNNGTPLLYGDAPYAPGSTDVVHENVRGSDVWAAVLQEVPHSNVQREALAKGEIPLWNRYNAGGRPLWGQGLTSMLDPLHWLAILTPDLALGWDLKFVAHRIVFAIGIGLAALAATGAWLPAVIVTAASPFIGIYDFRLNHPAIFATTYAPWVLFAWFMLTVARDRQRMAAAAIVLATSSALVLVAGTPKEAVVTLLGMEALGALAVLLSPGSWRERGGRLLAAAVAGVAALLITTPHWLVFLETLAESYTAYDQPYAQFARRGEAIGFFLGPLAPGPVQPGLHLLALVLTVAAITAPRHLLKHRCVLASGLVAAALMAIAFGAVPAAVIVRMPLLGNIGHIKDVFVAAALAPLLILGALGADVLLSASGRRTAVVSVFLGAACWWLFASARNSAWDDSLKSLMLLLVVPLAIALPPCFYATRRASQRMRASAATGLASIVLLLPGGLHADTAIPVLNEVLLQPRLRAAFDKQSPAVDAIHRTSSEPSRTAGLDWSLFAGSQAFYELEGIGGADPLELRTYRELVDAGGIWRGMVWITMVPTVDLPRLGPLLDLLDVKFLIVPVPGPDRIKVEPRATAWPRAFFVDGVTTYIDAPDLFRKVVALGKPLAAVQSSDSEAIGVTRGMSATASNIIPARTYKITVNTTSFIAHASGPGIAVLNETFLPQDFRATLNGRRVPYFRVNHAFKAVAIPSAGDWVVKFEYRPHHWDLSLLMASVGMVLLMGLGVSARRLRYVVGAVVSE